MALYGNLPEAKHPEPSPPSTAWQAAGKPASTLSYRAAVAPPPSVLRKQRPLPQPPGRQTGAVLSGAPPSEDDSGVGVGFSLFGDVEDEYDPARPNDYEEVILERDRKKREAQLEAEKQEVLRREKEKKDREERRSGRKASEQKRENLWDQERGQVKKEPNEHDAADEKSKVAMVKEMPSLQLGFERSPTPPSDDNRKADRSLDDSPQSPQRSGPGAASKDKGMTLAQRMLEKFGWREGEGLGKARQGMATPLIAQKTDKRSAVIVNAEKRKTSEAAPMMPPEKKPKGATLEGKPTKVVLLRNMVPPGEVDDELEEEVARELQKFGNVQRVLIFEVTEPDFPETESVRIFVKFLRIEEAIKAAVALQGRFFAGRSVKAGFYDESKFDTCDLAPVPGEFTIDRAQE